MSVEIYRRAPALAAAYRDRLPGFGAAPGLRDWAAGYAADHAGRCLWDARFLLHHGRTGRLLNIGGAPYLFEFALKHENPAAEIVSVDLDPGRFPHVEAALGIRVVAGNIESGGWEAGGLFDCIVLAEQGIQPVRRCAPQEPGAATHLGTAGADQTDRAIENGAVLCSNLNLVSGKETRCRSSRL